jgi:hypothetical protein
MLLFVSSFNNQDRNIVRGIVDNAKRIDKITGSNICFYYFVEDKDDWMNENTQNIKKYFKNNRDFSLLNLADGVEITMETANDICHHFMILRTFLPAFILVSKDKNKESSIFPVQNYEDLECFLTPLNNLHSYIDDKEQILKKYYDERNNVQGEDKSVVSPDKELEIIKNITTDKLNKSLNTSLGGELIELLDKKYASVISKIWDLVKTRKNRVAGIIEKIEYEIKEFGFD